jgi:hypothetical protein
MSAAFRRPRAEAPPVRISTGWVTDSHPLIWLVGIALCALAAFLYRADVHRAYPVGAPIAVSLGLGAFGLLVLAACCFNRGVYELVLDPKSDTLVGARVRGWTARSTLSVPLSRIASVTSKPEHPGRATSRHRVVLRFHEGAECDALPVPMRPEAEAQRIAALLTSALEKTAG